MLAGVSAGVAGAAMTSAAMPMSRSGGSRSRSMLCLVSWLFTAISSVSFVSRVVVFGGRSSLLWFTVPAGRR